MVKRIKKTSRKKAKPVNNKSAAHAEPIDGIRIYPTLMDDLSYWSAKMKTGYTQIQHAVAKVGDDPAEVQRWIEARGI